MESKQKHPLSHEEREVQTLVQRIDEMEVTREAARERINSLIGAV